MVKKIGMGTLSLAFISIGILFLLNNFIDFQMHLFLRILWPIFFIILGIEFIVAFITASRKNEEINLRISIISIFIILILSLFVGLMGLGALYFTENGLEYNENMYIEKFIY